MPERDSTPMQGKGRLLVDLLMEQLNIPKNCSGFDVHFDVDKAITVTVRMVVVETVIRDSVDLAPITTDTRVFRLVEQENG